MKMLANNLQEDNKWPRRVFRSDYHVFQGLDGHTTLKHGVEGMRKTDTMDPSKEEKSREGLGKHGSPSFHFLTNSHLAVVGCPKQLVRDPFL